MPEFIVEKVGMLEENCYLVPSADRKRLYIIDPGSEPEKICRSAAKLACEKAIILLTHAHVDHIGAISEVIRGLNIETVYLNRNDLPLYRSADNHLMPFVPAAKALPAPVHELESEDFDIIETPGHTPGGVCFYFKHLPALFSGDTLFAGSIGRTDLPGGDEETLLSSIRDKIMTLPEDVPVYPGHGPSSTVGNEKRNNPYVIL